MKSCQLEYYNHDTLKRDTENHNIVDSDCLLIQIFTNRDTCEEIDKLRESVTTLFPRAVIIGTTADGYIDHGKVGMVRDLLVFTDFITSRIYGKIIDGTGKICMDLGREMGSFSKSHDAKVMISFTDGSNRAAEDYLEGIYKEHKGICVSGGIAASRAPFGKTFIFDKKHIVSQGAVAVLLCNPHLRVHTASYFNWLPLGKEMTVTHAEGNRIYRIDGKPALELYRHYLGEEISSNLPGSGSIYPFIVEREGETIARAVIHVYEDGSLGFGGNFDAGEKIRFGYGDVQKILSDTVINIKTLYTKPIETLFIYSCMSRRHYMPNLVEHELAPFEKLAPTGGFFTLGEFYTPQDATLGTKPILLNHTMTILALSESDQTDMRPDFSSYLQAEDRYESIYGLAHMLDVIIDETKDAQKALDEQKRMIHAQQETIEHLQHLGKFSTWEWNLQEKRSRWSSYISQMYGFSEDQGKSMYETFSQVIVPKDRDRFCEIFMKLSDGQMHSGNFDILTPQNEIKTLLMSAQMLFNDEGVPVKILGTSLDITEGLQLKARNRELARLIDKSASEIVIVDQKNYYILYANETALEKLGYCKEEIKTLTIMDINQGISLEEVWGINDQLTHANVIRQRAEYIKKDGSTYPVQSYAEYGIYQGRKVAIFFNTDMSDIVQIEEKVQEQSRQLNFQAYHDALTRLGNRSLFNQRLYESIAYANEKQEKFALFFIDLDNFKEVNDTMGHHVGDMVLQVIAQRLFSVLGKDDTLARLGGDEFTIIAQNQETLQSAAKIAEAVTESVSEKIEVEGQSIYMTVSIGISMYPKDATEKSDLMKYADSAMYQAKKEGKNSYRFYSSEMTKKMLERVNMERELREAIEQESLYLVYQPQVNTLTGKIIGVEALVRWQHSQKGLIMPNSFIGLAEESNLIIELDHLVMRKAMHQMMQWESKGIEMGKLSLNLSMKHLMSWKFFAMLDSVLEETGFHIKKLVFEVTESQMMHNPEASIKKFKELHDRGIEISIDDFGTGYSSLAYLKRLPVDKLKIDHSFVKDLPYDEDDKAITNAVIALANSMQLDIIAEGVETQEQIEYLSSRSCHCIQGYYYTKPIKAAALEVFVKTHTAAMKFK